MRCGTRSNAISALFTTLQSYIAQYPGRYYATRVIDSIQAVLSGYGIRPDELDHVIRMQRCVIHGYTLLQAANGFQWSNDPDESVVWMIRFVNAGLTAVGDNCS